MAQHGSLEQLLLDSSRDDGGALAKPHAPVLPTLIPTALHFIFIFYAMPLS
jgi:hypothetical protein